MITLAQFGTEWKVTALEDIWDSLLLEDTYLISGGVSQLDSNTMLIIHLHFYSVPSHFLYFVKCSKIK